MHTPAMLEPCTRATTPTWRCGLVVLESAVVVSRNQSWESTLHRRCLELNRDGRISVVPHFLFFVARLEFHSWPATGGCETSLRARVPQPHLQLRFPEQEDVRNTPIHFLYRPGAHLRFRRSKAWVSLSERRVRCPILARGCACGMLNTRGAPHNATHGPTVQQAAKRLPYGTTQK